MAEEFQTGVCGSGGGGGSWWNSARTNSFSPPCTAAALNETMIGGFGWSTAETIDINARSSDESASSIITDSSSIHAFSDIHKPPPPPTDSAAAATGGVLIDSTLQMMGYNLSSSSTSSDWNPTLLPGSGRGEVNFHSILQEDAAAAASSSRLSKYSHHEQKDWGGEEDSNMINPFKPINLNQLNFPPEHQRLISTPGSNSGDCAASFPMSSPPYGYSTSTFLPNMIEIDPQPQQSSSLYYPSSSTNANESFSFLKPSLPKMQPKNNFHFSNNTTFWNAPSNAAAPGLTDIRAGLFPPQPQPQLQPRFLAQGFEEKPNLTSASTAKPNNAQEVKKSSGETLFKRPRIETPSPLPTFKVRKEKLGDRITALQQLVSPFGKTDTASVLHEAIEYIKFLHDQVSVLSTPYMKNGAPMQFQQVNEKLKEGEGPKQDLRSRGLCLVPISSIFPVTNETTTDYWTPTFGGTFR